MRHRNGEYGRDRGVIHIRYALAISAATLALGSSFLSSEDSKDAHDTAEETKPAQPPEDAYEDAVAEASPPVTARPTCSLTAKVAGHSVTVKPAFQNAKAIPGTITIGIDGNPRSDDEDFNADTSETVRGANVPNGTTFEGISRGVGEVAANTKIDGYDVFCPPVGFTVSTFD
ncbi:MAG: hypothetical protein AAB834_00260 [Patescibacteria group bacterium]